MPTTPSSATPQTFSIKLAERVSRHVRPLASGMQWLLLSFAAIQSAQAATVPGSILGEFAVSQGAASYSIPIAAAPGRGGMQPELSLNYSSNGGNGILGVGWSLGGLSAIHRCAATYAQDGFKAGINFNEKDRYCLDGQRLIPVSGSNGGVGTEYRTEIDGYSRIHSYGGSHNQPHEWKVETKAGQVMLYGDAYNRGSNASLNFSQGTMSWSIRTINDTTGKNPITFTYSIDQNSQYLEEISYTGGRVEVEYESRPDVKTAYALGNKIVAAKRVEWIDTFAGGVKLQRYEPGYSNVGFTGKSKINELSICNNGNSCLESLQLEWTSASGGLSFLNPVHYYPTGWNFGFDSNWEVITGDFNGDGLTDYGRLGGTYAHFFFSKGDGTFERPVHQYPSGWNFGNPSKWKTITGDFNGDGLTDYGRLGGTYAHFFFSNGDGTFERPVHYYPTGWNFGFDSNWEVITGDFNGDGLTDYGRLGGTYAHFFFSKGDGTFERPVHQYPSGWNFGNPSKWKTITGDFNGDGLTDYGRLGGTYAHFFFSNGDGTFERPVHYYPTGWNFGNPSKWKTITGDFNGDGQLDYARLGGTYSHFFTNEIIRESFDSITTSTGTKTHLTYKPLTDKSVYTKCPTADFCEQSKTSYPYQNLQYPQYVVSEVKTDNGIGGTNTVQYHYEGLKAHSRGRGLLGYSKITETYPQTGKTLETEFYQHGSVTLDGTTYNHDQANPSDPQYTTSYPFSGGVTQVTESYNGKKVNEAVTVMDTDPRHKITSYHSKGILQPKLKHSVQRSYELGNDTNPVTKVTTQQLNIDEYGNTGKVIVKTEGAGQAFTKTTDSTYSNNTTNWHLGRLDQTTVTHQSPYGDDDIRRSAFTYNSTTGLLDTESVISIQTGLALTTTRYSYDTYGQKTKVTLSAPNTSYQDRITTTAYNSLGKPTQTCNVIGQCETYTYTPEGWLKSTTGPNGITTTWQYDGFGRKTREDRADGTWSTVNRYFTNASQCGSHFDYSGQPDVHQCTVTQSSGSEPVVTQTDALGRTLRTIKTGFDGRKIYSDTHYNNESQVTKVSRDYFAGEHIYWAHSEYDALGRVTRMTEPGPHGSTNEITTQYNGLSTTVTSGSEGRSKTTLTNAIGQKVKITEEEGAYTDYTYNSDGSLLTTQVADNPESTITLSYDEFGRKSAMADPDMGNWSYTYTPFGELASQKDAKGQTTSMVYDRLGRMTSRTEAEGTSTWEYYANNAPAGSRGKLYQESGQGISKTFTYDQYGRPESATTTINGEGDFTTETEYDSLGRVKRVNYPGNQGFFTENIYNDKGFLEAVRGLRSHAQSHDYSELQPLITDATNLAGDYLEQAAILKAIGQQYQFWIREYQNVQASGAVHSGLRNELNKHKTVLTDTIATGQPTGTTTTQAQFIPIMVGDIMVPLVHEQHTQSLPPELMAHINNTLLELEAVNHLINTQIQAYATTAEQLTVLAEQTLAAADHNYQYARTLDGAAEVYGDYQSESATPYITYWRAVDVDSSGRISAEVYGNGIVNDYAYNQGTGQLQSIHSSLLVVEALRHLEYQYDEYNNVTLRDDLVNDIRETYDYDRLDRLTATDVVSSLYQAPEFNRTQSQSYNALGNITHKSDVGNYSYGAGNAGLHAVTRAGSDTYAYDANGNMTSGAGRTLTWSSFNKPTLMKQSGREAKFFYDANRSRYKKTNHLGDKTLYVGKLYEKVSKGKTNETQQKHYIYAAGQVVAEHIHSTTAGIQTRYLHKDALGSIDLITDAHANVVDRRSFDAWGKLRNMPWQTQAGLDDPLYLTQLPYTNKGYTGHEHVQEVDLIHMNGRVYDATLARFVSADPHIQAGSLSQSYNRYSYVMNNPMKYTDPSGYFFKKLKKAVSKAWKKIKPFAGVILGVVATVFCGACSAGIWSSVLTGAAIGAVSAGVNGGNILQGALVGGLTGGAAKYIGGANLSNYSKLGQSAIRGVAHGVVGGVANVIRGGKFGVGFASSFFTKMVSNPIQGYAEGLAGGAGALSDLAGATAAALVGGTASVIGGGKFANGAQTAAIQYLFNQVGDRAKRACGGRPCIGRSQDNQKNWRIGDPLPKASGKTFLGYLWNRTLDGTVANDLNNASWGFIDGISANSTQVIRSALNIDLGVNENSIQYSNGDVLATAMGAANVGRISSTATKFEDVYYAVKDEANSYVASQINSGIADSR